MKISMKRGDAAKFYWEKFDSEIPVVSFEHGYIWIGGKNGPCYAHLSGNKRLRSLALKILRETRPKRKKK